MIELSLNNVEKYYGANQALKDLTFQVSKGVRVGIVGRNGTGKTTIFKVITGIENYDNGIISIRKGSSIGYLEQIPDYPSEYRAKDVLNEAFRDLLELQSTLRELEVKMSTVEGGELNYTIKKYGDLRDIFETKGGYEIEEKMSKVCNGLGFNQDFLNMEFNDLSGGEKTTVILGKILLEGPDILLLDEPTNHLDMSSMSWLESYLTEYNGTVLIISHDRYFLDSVVNKIVEIENGTAKSYAGNYSSYVEEKDKVYLEELKRYENQQKKIRSMEESIKRLKDWADRGDNENMFRRAFSMEKRLEKMEKVDKPVLDTRNIKLNFSIQDRSGKDVIGVKGLQMKLEGKTLFNNLNFSLKYGERVAILGKNGSGKTTLLKTILGEISADEGEVKIGVNVKIGYLQQNIHFNNEDDTVLDIFREGYICSETEARNILSRFLFYSEDIFKRGKNLSGGERARLRLCQLMYKDVNTLILDEPTNHLDIMSREMLEETLNKFQGSIIFVSHDRYFINKIADRIDELSNGTLKSYYGDYDYYKEKRLNYNNVEEPHKKSKEYTNKKVEDSKKTIKDTPNAKRIKEIEDDIKKQETLLKEKEIELDLYSTDYIKLNDLYKEKVDLKDKLDKLLDEWIRLNE
ncbi:ribosomal protection-like ABC-F family protein [Paratissierella segnis]|jgi:ATPase subunit of ABC transporter with duplicated ATPase domains|uniref:ABC-F type ribosomal protection protein n=1 Tax=Paratissierella segnis TaxID=2763679 RepID=A0A926ERL7_9FIRM|nr:ABC-F type ribosomal protection protein [Paratissierella segnis]MBC8587576.1 ABC-F type ribosomal protection protein [Paratissierella segnis]